jgi:propanediol dehydratase large subunit
MFIGRRRFLKQQKKLKKEIDVLHKFKVLCKKYEIDSNEYDIVLDIYIIEVMIILMEAGVNKDYILENSKSMTIEIAEVVAKLIRKDK